MKIRVSLINQLIATIVFFILFFGLLAIIFVYFYSKNSFLANDLSHFQELSVERTHETFLILDRARDLVESVATKDELLSQYLSNPNKPQADLILNNFRLYNIRTTYSAIYLMDKNGNTLVSTDESFVGQNYSFRDYFKKSIMGTSHVDLAIGVTSKQLGYYFSYPVKNSSGDVLGVLVLKMMPDFVNNTLESDFHTAKIMLVDEYGVIVYSSQPNRLFNSLGELSKNDQEDLKQKRRYEEVEIKPLQYKLIADNLNKTETITLLEYFDQVDGEEEVISIARLGDLPFFIITEDNKSLYNSQAINLSLVLVIFIFMAVMLTILSIYIILKNYLSLLDDLKIMADKLKLNDFNFRITSRGHSDLADIANSFNLVAESLQNNKINTEQIIVKRTKQLEKINKIMVGRELEIVNLKNKINKANK